MHCSPGSKSRASSYVDGKNRQRVFGVMLEEHHERQITDDLTFD